MGITASTLEGAVEAASDDKEATKDFSDEENVKTTDGLSERPDEDIVTVLKSVPDGKNVNEEETEEELCDKRSLEDLIEEAYRDVDEDLIASEERLIRSMEATTRKISEAYSKAKLAEQEMTRERAEALISRVRASSAASILARYAQKKELLEDIERSSDELEKATEASRRRLMAKMNREATMTRYWMRDVKMTKRENAALEKRLKVLEAQMKKTQAELDKTQERNAMREKQKAGKKQYAEK